MCWHFEISCGKRVFKLPHFPQNCSCVCSGQAEIFIQIHSGKLGKTWVFYVNPKSLSIRLTCAPKVLMTYFLETHRYLCDWKAAIKFPFKIDWNNFWSAKKCPCQSCLYYCPKAYILDLFQNFPGAQESGSCQRPLWTSVYKGVDL